MALNDEFIAEVNAAIDTTIAEAKLEEKSVANVEVKEPGRPAPETVVENDEPVIDSAVVSDDNGDKAAVGVAETSDGETKPEVKPVAPTKPEFGDDTLTAAVKIGFSLADARQFPSEQALRSAIATVNAVAQQSAPKQEEKTEGDPLADIPKLDPEVYEPEVIKMFDALVGVVRKQQEAIQSFRSVQEQATRVSMESAAHDVEQWFDKQVESLGSDFEDALGKGGYGTLNRGSEQFARRDKIANQMAVMLAGYRAAGQQAPPREEIFDAAARLALKDEYQKAYEKKLAGNLAKRSTQHLQRAGGQKTKSNQNPLEATAALLDERFFKK